MKLRDYALTARAFVPVPGAVDDSGKPDGFRPRGLSLVDILEIVENHREALGTAFGELNGDTDKLLASPGAIGQGLLNALPDVAAEVIAVSLDEPDNVAEAKGMVASIQLAILEKVAEQTFIAEGGAGKVVEIVISAVAGTGALVSGLSKAPKGRKA